jgi:hypothetical protein
MSTATLDRPAPEATRASLRPLAVKEIGRYARHPVFLVGLLFVLATSLTHVDPQMSTLESVISPAAGFGLFGLVTMNSLALTADRVADTAGAVPLAPRVRTLGLVAALAVPVGCGLAWFAWAVWAFHRQPPGADGAPFGGVGNGWAYAILFALGTVSCAGGPILGLVVARWIDVRGAAAVTVVLLILVTIVMQGIVVGLRPYRPIMPWTHFTGPYGIPGDPNRVLILTGSPAWYAVYLVLLCIAGVLLALLHDEGPRRRLLIALGVVGACAVLACVLACTTGVDHTMVNPVHSIAR